MLKNKIIVRKIRNIVILVMAIIVMIGAYKNIDKSRAEDVREIGAIALDDYGYLTDERFMLEAKKTEENMYEIELPQTINGKKINEIIQISLEDFATKSQETTTESEQPAKELTQETTTEPVVEEKVEIIENKIYLTEEQIEKQEINIQVEYEMAIIKQNQEGVYEKTLLSEKTEEERKQLEENGTIVIEDTTSTTGKVKETQALYSKILRYEDKENGKLVELKGYLPVDAELKVEEVTQEKLTEIFGKAKIDVAYDIKILVKVVTQVPVDEANPEAEIEEIVETIEINPEEFGEKCEVSIKDANIATDSKVYHVKEDKTYEKVNVKENTDGDISFEAQTFSIYAISDDEMIPDEGIETGISLGVPAVSVDGYFNYYSEKAKAIYVATSSDFTLECILRAQSANAICENPEGVCSGGPAHQKVSHYYTESGYADGNFMTYFKRTITEAGYYRWLSYNSDMGRHCSGSSAVELYVIAPPGAPTVVAYQNADGTTYTPGTWTNQVVHATPGPSGAETIGEGTEFGELKYHISTDDSTWVDYVYDSSNELYVMSTEGEHTRYYRAENLGGYIGESISAVAKIDLTNPTPATLQMKLENAEGEDYANNTWTKQNVYIALNNDASDALSGVDTVTYTITKNGEEYLTNQTEAMTLTESGLYIITVTTKDVAGNTATNTYTVKIDKEAPIWSVENLDVNEATGTVTANLIGTDNLSGLSLEGGLLTTNLLTVIVAGTEDTQKQLTGPVMTEDGKIKYELTISNVTASGGGYITVTPIESIVGETAQYKNQMNTLEDITITIAEETLRDNVQNLSEEHNFENISGVDRTPPEIFEVQKTQDASTQKATIIFNVTDRNYVPTELITLEEITALADGEPANSIEKTILSTQEIKAVINEETVVIGHQYTVELSKIVEKTKQPGKNYLEWSGNIGIQIAENATKDTSNIPNVQTTTGTQLIDFIKPEIVYTYSQTDINKQQKTVKIVFTAIDKNYKQGTLAIEDLTIKINGEEPVWKEEGAQTAGVTKKLDKEPIQIQKNGETATIGHTYTLTLSELQQKEIESGENYLNYSGIVTVVIPDNKIMDMAEQTNYSQTITVGIDVLSELPRTEYSNPYLPTGYSYFEGNLDTGIVIKDGLGNEYVWVEVPTNIYDNASYNTETTEGDRKPESENDYEDIEYCLHKYTATYRKSTKNVDKWYSAAKTGIATEEEYNVLKRKMLRSIYKNGGFYVGRYETGIKDAPKTSGSTSTAPTETPVIKQNAYPYNFVSNAQAQTLASSFATEGYETSLLFGVQWDLVLKYMETKAVQRGEDEATAISELNTNSTSVGNYANNNWTIENVDSKYSSNNGSTWTDGLYNDTGNKGNTTSTILLSTGASDKFSRQNIYDIAGNLWEWTLEYYNTSDPCVRRGGLYTLSGASYPASIRGGQSSSLVGYATGFRVALYEDIEGEIVDVVDPKWTASNINIDEQNQKVTLDLQVTDKYFEESTITSGKISINVDGTNATSINIELSEPIDLTETRTINGVETEVKYGEKYSVTINNWQEVAKQVGKPYREWSGTAKLVIEEGAAEDQSNNTNKELEIPLGHIDFMNPEISYIYSGTTRDPNPSANPDINYNTKTVKIVFSVTDKYFDYDNTKTALDYLNINDLTIFIDGEVPEWRTEGGTTGVTRTFTGTPLTETRSKADGTTENVTVGFEYTLLLSNLEQNPNDGINYSGIVTVAIPAGKFADTSEQINYAQSITVGINIEDEMSRTEYTNPYLPTGYSYLEGDLDTGIVIKDALGNEYVWVEVPTNIYDNASYNTETTEGDMKPESETDYEKIEYCLKSYTTTYKNTSYSDIWKSAAYSGIATEEEYNALKQKMLKSVYKNGGFYVGRYETGIEGAPKTSGSKSTDPTETPVIKQNAYPYNFVTVSQSQVLANSFAPEGYKTSLLFGVQWDLIMKYIETKAVQRGEDEATIISELKTNSTNFGNYENTNWTITNTDSKYSSNTGSSWTEGLYKGTGVKGNTTSNIMLSTGASNQFSKQNIYDLGGNVWEWTLEYGSSRGTTRRGGDFAVTGSEYPIASRYYSDADTVSHAFGFRVALYEDVQDGEIVDVVDPVWELEELDLDAGIIKVTATDKHYKTSSLNESNVAIKSGETVIEGAIQNITGPVEIEAGKKYQYTITLSEIDLGAAGENAGGGAGGGIEFTPLEVPGETIVGGTAVYKGSGESSIILQINSGAIEDESGNVNKTQDFELINMGPGDVLPEVYNVQKIPNAEANTVTFIFNVTDGNYDETDLITKSELELWIDNIEISSLLTNATLKSVPLKLTETQTVGHQYTLVIPDFIEETRQEGKSFKEWSGTLELKIAETAAKDLAGHTLKPETTTISEFIDIINPEFTYKSSNTTIVRGNTETVTIIFDVTDKYFASTTLSSLDASQITVSMPDYHTDETNELNAYLNTGSRKQLTKLKDVYYDTTAGTTYVDSGITGTGDKVGERYQIVISGLDTGDGFAYSGYMTLSFGAGTVIDTKGNLSPASSITIGLDDEDGNPGPDTPGDGTLVDVVDPIWEKVSSSAYAVGQTATITVKGTDKYFASSDLTGKIKVLAHTNGMAAGATATDITSSVTIQIGETVTPVYKEGTQEQIGNEYTITVTGFAVNINQLKIEIQEGAILDTSENGNNPTQFILYNCLKLTNSETAQTSGFLGETSIQRQHIEKIILSNSTSTSTSAGVKKVWDVSAAGDNSILAWHSQSTAPYTVYIGSNDQIFANRNSDYLFQYIGYHANCTKPEAIERLDLLDTSSVSSMDYMFCYFGYDAMTKLELGSNFDTKNVTSMERMFNDCGYNAMTSLDFGNKFDTSNVTDMKYMFRETGYTAMKSLVLPDTFDTSNVTHMQYMFRKTGNTAMTKLDLGKSFDTSKVKYMQGMFSDMRSGSNDNIKIRV